MRLIRYISYKEMNALNKGAVINPLYEPVVYFFKEERAPHYIERTGFIEYVGEYNYTTEENVIFYGFIASDINGVKDYAIVVDIPKERIKFTQEEYSDPTYVFLDQKPEGDLITIEEATVEKYSIEDVVEIYELEGNMLTVERID